MLQFSARWIKQIVKCHLSNVSALLWRRGLLAFYNSAGNIGVDFIFPGRFNWTEEAIGEGVRPRDTHTILLDLYSVNQLAYKTMLLKHQLILTKTFSWEKKDIHFAKQDVALWYWKESCRAGLPSEFQDTNTVRCLQHQYRTMYVAGRRVQIAKRVKSRQ